MGDIFEKKLNNREMPKEPQQEKEEYQEKITEPREDIVESAGQEVAETGPEPKERLAEEKEAKQAIESDKVLREKLEQEIVKMRLDPDIDEEAEEQAKQIKALDVEGKAKRLLAMAQEKGLAFAVKTAEKMNDPYLLDVFHDILAKQGLYQKFEK